MEHSGSVQACNGTALPSLLHVMFYDVISLTAQLHFRWSSLWWIQSLTMKTCLASGSYSLHYLSSLVTYFLKSWRNTARPSTGRRWLTNNWCLCRAKILFRLCLWSSSYSLSYKYVSLHCLQLPVFTNTQCIIKSLPPLLRTVLVEMHLFRLTVCCSRRDLFCIIGQIISTSNIFANSEATSSYPN